MGAGRLAGFHQLLVGGVRVAPAQVLPDGAAEQHVLLQHHGHAVAQHVQVVVLHRVAAHGELTAGDVVKAGDQLHQRGLGAAGAAQDAHRLARADGQADVAEHVLAGGLGILEVHMVELHAAVLQLGAFALRRAHDLGPFVQHLHDALDGGPADDQLGEGHADHHQAHQNLSDIADEAHQFAAEHHAADDKLAAEPEDGDDAAVHRDLHDGHQGDDDALRLDGLVHQAVVGFPELLLFVLRAHEGLHHPDGDEVLLHAGVQPVIAGQHGDELGIGQPDDAHKGAGQHGNGHEEHRHQLAVDGKGHEGGADEHHRRAHQHADAHLVGVLGVGHVGGQTGHKAGSAEFVHIGKAEILHIAKSRQPQLAAEAHGGHGGKTAAGPAHDHARQGHQNHQKPQLCHIGKVAVRDAHIHDAAHQQRDGDLQQHFGGHAQRRKDGLLLIGARIL